MAAMSWGDEFQGKRVVVTGACGIYGRWIAKAFDAVGAKLCLSDMKGDDLDKFASELKLSDKGGLTHKTDLTDAGSIDDLVASVSKAWGAADIVVNNAGIYPSGFLLDIDAKEWDRIIGVNLRAPFLVSRGFAKLMIQHKVKGSIVDTLREMEEDLQSSISYAGGRKLADIRRVNYVILGHDNAAEYLI